MPLQATSGAASYDAFGGGVAAVPNYIEDVFSTWLYTGNDSTQTIPNGIDLSTKGGLVWTKTRNVAQSHQLVDTVRGQASTLISNSTNAASINSGASSVNSFLTTGYVAGVDFSDSTRTYASWTFREQPKFFDVVTYTGTGTASQTVSHNLGSAPGCIIIKRTDSTSNWFVGHNYDANRLLYLNTTAAATTLGWNSWIFDPTTFRTPSISGSPDVNVSGATYVAYLFAHNAGGFGLTGTDNVISCGLTTANGSGDFSVNLGYEPQWVLMKSTSSGIWSIVDNMRGATASSGYTSSQRLQPQSSAAEDTLNGGYGIGINATGFTGNLATFSNDFIYIAIRRGPMKVPTSGTSVFQPLTRSGTGGATTVTSTVRPDTVLQNWRDGGLGSANHFMYDRLRGVARALFTDTTDAESSQTPTGINAFNNLSYGIAGAGSMNNGSALYADYVFTRAPGFFDEVCYTGTGVARTVAHNLGVAPELMIVKRRSDIASWAVYSSSTTATKYLMLDSTNAADTWIAPWNDTTPTSSVFTVRNAGLTNASGETYVAYLFASCPGVSKVGSYTGTGTTQTINCGFTSGARFVLIKRTDSTGDWYVWDSARGIVAGNDPYLLLNSTAAEVTSTDYIDTASTGFEISSTAPAAINASGGTFIFLAIA